MAKVKVYKTETCPYCKMLVSWLEEKGIDHEEIYVDRDPAKQEEMLAISDGHMGVPFSVVTKDDGSEVKITGFDRGKFEEALGVS